MRVLYIGKWIRGFKNLYDISKRYDLSPEAQYRLNVIGYYHTRGEKNASLTAKYFGIHRNTVRNWLNLYNEKNLFSLEPKKSAPIKRFRKKTSEYIVSKVIEYKKLKPYLGKDKLARIFERDFEINISASTVGRIIFDNKLAYLWRTYESACNFKKTIRKQKKKKRPPKAFIFKRPGYWIQIDTVRVFYAGKSVYVINAVDLCTRFAFSYAYSSPASANAKDFLEKLSLFFYGKYKIRMVQTDNGSEFHKYFDTACKNMSIEHTFSYVRSPKMNAFVESYNGYIQRECLVRKDVISPLNILNNKIINYCIEYNSVRPHSSLAYKTPLDVYCSYFQNTSQLHKRMWTHSYL